jgi:hypothetical protein
MKNRLVALAASSLFGLSTVARLGRQAGANQERRS